MLLICVIYDVLFNFTFLPLEPSGTPQAVTVNMISSGSIFVSWNPVIADDRNGIIKGYKVNYQALPNGDMVAKFLNVTYEQQNKRQTVILDNLNEFTNYSIRVLAFTTFGNGPASFSQVVETLGGSKFYASIFAVIFTFLCLLLHLITSSYRQHVDVSLKGLFFSKTFFVCPIDAEIALCDTKCFFLKF